MPRIWSISSGWNCGRCVMESLCSESALDISRVTGADSDSETETVVGIVRRVNRVVGSRSLTV